MLLPWVKLREGAQGHGQDQGEAGRHWAGRQGRAKCKNTLLSTCASAHLARSTSFKSVPRTPRPSPIPGPLPTSLPQPGSFWKEGFGGCLPTPPSKGCPSWQSLRRTGTVLPQGLCTCCFLRPEGSFLRHLHDSIPCSLHIFAHIPSESFPDLPGLGSDPSSSDFAFFPRSMRLGHRAMFILPTFCLPPPGREHHLARTCKDFVYFF